MRLWAKVRFGRATRNIEAAFLMDSFFQNFDASNSIEIKGEEATLEIFFESNPPIQIVSAIKHCSSFELHYGSVPTSFEGAEIFTDTQKVSNPSIPDQSSQSENGNQTTLDFDKSTEETSLKSQENPSLPKEFLGFQNRAHSYEEFKDLVIQWLSLKGKSLDLLENAIELCEQSNNLSWNAIEEHYENKGLDFSPNSKININQTLSRRFKDSSHRLTFLPLVKAIVQFRNFNFVVSVNDKDEKSIPLILDEQQDKVSYEPEASSENAVSLEMTSNSIEMQSVPMSASLKEALQTLDKMRPVEERIKHILNGMGLDSPDIGEEMRRTILQVAITAVSHPQDEFENVVGPVQRMVFSTFINEFAGKNGADYQKIHLLDFLDELKNVIS